GNGQIEGILSIIDTLKANNFIATGIAEFFDNVVFHIDVRFEGRPAFNKDTAGHAVIKAGCNEVTITFEKEYANFPVVTASVNAANGVAEDEIQGSAVYDVS